jgi:hypothetical protein
MKQSTPMYEPDELERLGVDRSAVELPKAARS